MKKTLLLRDRDEEDSYEAVLSHAGYVCAFVPVLRFTAVNRDALRRHLETPRSFSGLVLTSPRAVDALGDVLGWLPSETARWHSKPVFAVGPATAGALRAIGFEPEGEGSGSAELLADYIAHRSFEAPLLFLCGNRRRDVLSDRLQAAGVAVEEVCVYETHVRDDLDLTNLPTPRWAVFFSPSGVEAARGAAGLDWSSVRRAALGPTTAEALDEAGWPADAVAAEPTPEALAEALVRADGEG